MVRPARYLPIVILLSTLLAACQGIAGQAEPTLTPIPSSTASPVPTNTPEPSTTPEPTARPSPLPTATTTPTPTAQLGETRIDPETGKEEIFSDIGAWVKVIPAWDIAIMGLLPGLTKNNASYEILEDGSVKVAFSLADKTSELNGEEFVFVIPSYKDALLTVDGSLVQGRVTVGELTSNEPKRMQRQWPLVTMEGENESLAYFDWINGQWVPRYKELLTNLGSQEVAGWMPQNVGLAKSRFWLDEPGIRESELISSGANDDGFAISMISQPHRVFEENILDGGTIVRTETWAEMIYNDKGHTLLLLVFSSDCDIRHHINGITSLNIDGFVNKFDNWNKFKKVEKAEFLTFIEQSPRARIRFSVFSHMPPELKQFAQDLFDTGQSDINHVRTEFSDMFFFLN